MQETKQIVEYIRQMNPADLELLHQTCCETYSQNFHHHWNNNGLTLYMEKVFGKDILTSELSDPNIQYYVSFVNEVPVAFMKLNLFSNLPDLDNNSGIELDKVYILPQYKGMKIGKRLLDLAFDIARKKGKEIFWLSVIDTNKEAIAFYEKIGFKFHSQTRLEYPNFKEELKGMWRMYFKIQN